MRYFYAVHAQANEQNEVSFFILPQIPKAEEIGDKTETQTENLTEDKIPELTADTVKQNPVYAEFAKKKFGLVMVTYTIYGSESAELKEEHLQQLIDNNEVIKVAGGEIQIASAKNAAKAKKKKLKLSKEAYWIITGAAALSIVTGIGIGVLFFNGGKSDNPVNNTELPINESDGLIMPDAVKFDPNAELITVSIDRSYYAVPREDVQLKGEITDGAAVITLPYFDKNDFFTHIPGHTWGFTSDPNGTKIEYCGGQTYSFTDNVKLYRVLVKYGGGNGTKDDPYLINWFDQFELMAREKARGYFRQTDNITFPERANHTPINTVNELKLAPGAEYFEYDGGGYAIDGLTAPLFGTVSGSVIQNVNVTNANIETEVYKNYGVIVCEAYNYRYEVNGKTYETGETVIKNCSVSNSAINIKYPEPDGNTETMLPAERPPLESVMPPELEGETGESYAPPPKHAEFAVGGITGLGGQIENCYVANSVISAKLNDYFLYVGGMSGKPANVVNSGVYSVTIGGNIFNTGGIAGSAGGSRLYSADGAELPIFYGGNIQGCYVRKFNGTAENCAGGIAGEAGTNAENALISNSYATGLYLLAGIFEEGTPPKLIKPGITGGVVGADGNEDNGHLITNAVSVADYAVIGAAGKSVFDETVRLAPHYAFNQSGILDVLNKNTVTPDNPKEIFTGSFMFAEDARNSDAKTETETEGVKYAFPSEIFGLLEIVHWEELQNE